MNNKGTTNVVGLPSQDEGYLSWQDPESGEWMALTPKGSPYSDGVRNAVPEPAVVEGSVGRPRRTCDRCASRFRIWRSPSRGGHAVD